MQKSNLPILKHITDFLEYLEIERGAASKTQENYSRYLHKFANWLRSTKSENLKPHELTPEHVWQYRIFLARSPISETSTKTLSKKTQNFYLIALRNLLTFFTDRDIDSLPMEKIKLTKREKSEQTVKFLTLDQVEKLLLTPTTSHNIGLRDRAILEILFSTGLRIAELVALDRNQFKIKPDTKDIELSITGKGGHVRTVYFSDRAVRWLKKYLDTRNDD
ncbi:MAG TPA: tyrosine-type recombinase/integrase, partial [Candidatus Portnoybacteria bacterium]|nr:tyrosine-type recombinase/integrase [Candidatus Portnoybacteria bacterium]